MQLARPWRAATGNTETTDDQTEFPAGDDLVHVERARENIADFGPLYERYAPLIQLYCYRRLNNAEDADDATSLVFTRAIAAIGRFQPDRSRPGSTFRAWLFTIARNVVLDRYRRARPQFSLDEPEIAWRVPDPGTLPEDHAIAIDEAQSVARILRHIPDRQRAVVELRLAGLTTAEIGIALNLTIPAVKSMQVRAFRTLREVVASSPIPHPERF